MSAARRTLAPQHGPEHTSVANATIPSSFALENDSFLVEAVPSSDPTSVRLDYNLRQHGNEYRTVGAYAIPPNRESHNYRDSSKHVTLDLNERSPPAFTDFIQVPLNLKVNRRRWLERLAFLVLIIATTVLLYSRQKNLRNSYLETATGSMRPLRHKTALSGFRDNLWEDGRYVTAFPYGGLTNQLIEQLKLVHLAKRLDRIAILPDLTAAHDEGSNVPLSTFFDLIPFSTAANVTALTEWSSVKFASRDSELELLSCWGRTNTGLQPLLDDYRIQVTFWPAPRQLTVPVWDTRALSFPSIEVLVTSDQSEWLESVRTEVIGSTALNPAIPDSQLLCFANLFYVRNPVRYVEGVVDSRFTVEELDPTDPIWHDVGRYLHFNAPTNRIADDILSYLLPHYTPPALRHALQPVAQRHKLLQAGTPFIAVHLRQGDFVSLSRASNPLSAYIDAVELLQHRLPRLLHPAKKHFSFGGKKGEKSLPVLFATDSKDRLFLKKVTDIGWIYIDHTKMKTKSNFGGWYPGIIDSLILSRSVGFVGSKQSTFSYITARRVEEWSGGLSSIVGDAPIPPLLAKGHFESSNSRSGRNGASGRDRLNG